MQKSIAAKAVREIMTASPITVSPDTSIRELKILFERHQVNAFPVVDDRGVLCGIVSKGDLLRVFRPDPRRWLSGLFALWAERVEDIMSRGIDAVEPADPVAAAVDLMIVTGRRSLPVVERRPMGPVLVGMVSRTDLLPCLTLAAAESPMGGTAHGPAPASSPRGPRRFGRSRGGPRRLTALVRGAAERFLAMSARTLHRRGRRRDKPRVGSAAGVAVSDDRMASARVP